MSTTLYPSCDMKILALEQKLARADARIAELEAENKNLTNAITQLRWATSFEKE